MWKDIRRGQITPDQARLIVDQLAADGLLIPFQVDCYRAKIDTIEAVGVSEGCQPRNLTTPYFAR
ncbi:MAG: hypothetical protein KKA73_22065 [Chloroflexi bacterium]|nr:hypothetical protein [Chloroflexota bacterium]MBU1750379.1 hypothetical protein [Chloroflexota bacterium]